MGTFSSTKRAGAVLAGTLMIAGAGNALAADQWLACEGTVATTGTNQDGEALNESKSFSDIYVYNDDLQGLYLYSKDKKMLSPMHVATYGASDITWSGEGSFGARWDGTLDRSGMSVNIVRTEKDERAEWNGQCKATSAQPLAS